MPYIMNKETFADLFDKSAQELRRGALVLATLSQLHAPKYGYALINSLSDKGLQVEQGTLYPLLRRLEGQGLLESEWNVDGSRPRRYYTISAAGREMLVALENEWFELVRVMGKFLPDGRLVEKEQ